MPAFDFNLGGETGLDNHAAGTGSQFTVPLTTTHAASAGTRVVVNIYYFAGDTSRVTGVADNGGGTFAGAYTLDKRVANGGEIIDTWSCPQATGLASGRTITASFPAATGGGWGGILMSAMSVSDVDMTNGAGVDTTASFTAASGTAWSSGAASAVAGGISVGFVGTENAATNVPDTTPAVGTLVSNVWRSVSGQGMASRYLVVAAGAAGAVSGTLASASTAMTGALVIYKTAGPPPVPVQSTLAAKMKGH